MAQTYTNTGTQKGNFDGLIDFLKRVAWSQTPFLNLCGDTKAIATTHKWVSEDLNDAADNTQAEGFTVTPAAANVKKRTLESNEVELIARSFSFSNTQEAVKKAGGITSDYDREKEKKFKEIALDLNRDLLIQTLQTRVADSGTAGKMNGLINALTTFTLNLTNNSVAGILTEDIYNRFVQTVTDGGAQVDTVLCAGFNRRQITSWAQPFRQYNDDNKIQTSSTMKYDGDWGVQDVVYDKIMTGSNVAVFEKALMSVAYLRAPFHEELGVTLDGRQGYCGLEATLQYGSAKAGGIISGTATAS